MILGKQDKMVPVSSADQFHGVGRSVVLLRSMFGRQTYYGTAFLCWRAADGVECFATAGNCVRNIGLNGKERIQREASTVELLVDGQWYDVTSGVRVDPRYSKDNIRNGRVPGVDDGFDVAFIVTNSAIGKSLTCCHLLPNDVENEVGATAIVVGFAGEKIDPTTGLPMMYGAQGKVTQVIPGVFEDLGGKTVAYHIDTTGGESGGPVVMKVRLETEPGKVTEEFRVIGVHNGGVSTMEHNVGSRINAKLMNFLREIAGPEQTKGWASDDEPPAKRRNTHSNGQEEKSDACAIM